MTDNPRKPFGGKGTMDGYRCELCGAWVEYRDLGKVLAHEGPLPHVEQDRPAVGDRTDRDRKKPPPVETIGDGFKRRGPQPTWAMSKEMVRPPIESGPYFGGGPAFRSWETAVTS